MSQDVMMGTKASNRTKIIKRYQNRKLYDTQQSCYVTLDDIAKMIRSNEEVMVIDNKTKNDITAATLTQIIFESEKKASQYAPLYTLREIIQYGNGSISSYLAKLGAFPMDYYKSQPAPQQVPAEYVNNKSSFDDVKQTLEERVANAATAAQKQDAETIIPAGYSGDVPQDLPNPNRNWNN